MRRGALIDAPGAELDEMHRRRRTKAAPGKAGRGRFEAERFGVDGDLAPEIEPRRQVAVMQMDGHEGCVPRHKPEVNAAVRCAGAGMVPEED